MKWFLYGLGVLSWFGTLIGVSFASWAGMSRWWIDGPSLAVYPIAAISGLVSTLLLGHMAERQNGNWGEGVLAIGDLVWGAIIWTVIALMSVLVFAAGLIMVGGAHSSDDFFAGMMVLFSAFGLLALMRLLRD